VGIDPITKTCTFKPFAQNQNNPIVRQYKRSKVYHDEPKPLNMVWKINSF
jgi:hypothetical protein